MKQTVKADTPLLAHCLDCQTTRRLEALGALSFQPPHLISCTGDQGLKGMGVTVSEALSPAGFLGIWKAARKLCIREGNQVGFYQKSH